MAASFSVPDSKSDTPWNTSLLTAYIFLKIRARFPQIKLVRLKVSFVPTLGKNRVRVAPKSFIKKIGRGWKHYLVSFRSRKFCLTYSFRENLQLKAISHCRFNSTFNKNRWIQNFSMLSNVQLLHLFLQLNFSLLSGISEFSFSKDYMSLLSPIPLSRIYTWIFKIILRKFWKLCAPKTSVA